MMKIIENDYRLDNLLNVWTGKIPLSSGSYYFWAAGSRHQRSLVGLYRTLLFRILKAQNFPCRIAFPEWQLRFAKIKPSLEMFVAAMRNLLGSQALTTNFFFIIDGPDEFERDSIGKAELAELMLEMTKTRRVKILLSSRPETPFENAFGSCPRLRLETLTRPDILAYISAKLWANPLLRKMPPHEESQVRQITNALSDSAEGVFLWVVLVVRIVLDGINNHEDFEMIQNRVEQLPPELDDLFSHIKNTSSPPSRSVQDSVIDVASASIRLPRAQRHSGHHYRYRPTSS